MWRFLSAITLALIPGMTAAADAPAEAVLYDFEQAADLKGWANLELPKAAEPAVKIELAADHATSGKQSLKLTFAGGQWPTVTTEQVSQDWLRFDTFKADVTVSRPCVVGFTTLQEKSQRGPEAWEALISRWSKTAFLKPGKNAVTGRLPDANGNGYAVHAKWGKVVRFEIFMYAPHDGETIHVDNIRLCNETVVPAAKSNFTIQGTGWTVPGNGSAEACRELGRNLAPVWNKPAPKSLEDAEAEFQAKYAAFKKRFPKAVLAVLRDGEKGYDPADPDKVYAGWKDAYWTSHGPDSNFVERATNRGRAATHEIFMRHRSPLMRVDVSSIPAGSTILAAQLVLVRSREKSPENDPEKQPSMLVAQPCNRPWEEYEVNAFQYAKDKFWADVGGTGAGDDPDFLPTFLAFGPGRPGKVNVLDFTQAVRFWTAGKQANHGFMVHGDSNDYMMAHAREAAEVKNRPSLSVVYVPK